MLEFCTIVLDVMPPGEEVIVSLVTGADTDRHEEQAQHLRELQESLSGTGLRFEYEVTWTASTPGQSRRTPGGRSC